MKKYIAGLLFGLLLLFVGCSHNELTGESPPKAFVSVGNQTEEMVLGSYSWNGISADAPGPVILLEGKEPIKVKPGEVISFEVDYEIKPSEASLTQQVNEDIFIEMTLTDNSFIAPTEKGIYYFSYDVSWMDSEVVDVYLGNAAYAFAIEVE